MTEYHHLHNVLLVVNHKCGHCIQLHLQAKPEIITSSAWVYSVVCWVFFFYAQCLKNEQNDPVQEWEYRVKMEVLHKIGTIDKNTTFFVSVSLIPKFTVHNFIQTQLHSSVIYWQSQPEEIIWL